MHIIKAFGTLITIGNYVAWKGFQPSLPYCCENSVICNILIYFASVCSHDGCTQWETTVGMPFLYLVKTDGNRNGNTSDNNTNSNQLDVRSFIFHNGGSLLSLLEVIGGENTYIVNIASNMNAGTCDSNINHDLNINHSDVRLSQL